MDTKESVSAGGVVINSKGEVLVVSQRGMSWSLPKGHIDPGETDLEAAKREVLEESGISNLELMKPLGEYKRYKISKDGGDDKSELKTMKMFLFRTPENALKPIDPENPEAKWVEKDEVANLLTHYKDKEFFLRIVKEI
jgi:8-oxo-dGTP pyrophosphatase MutT (NUDIX family)